MAGHFLADNADTMALELALYRQLGEGTPVAREALAEVLGMPMAELDALIEGLSDSRVDVDEDGKIVAFGGLSQIPANHVFLIGALKLHTWCVFDALFLPQILGKSASLATHCPVTGSRIEIDLAPDIVMRASPADLVMSTVVPDRAACCANLRGAFCNHVNFFVDAAACREWAAGRSDIGHMPLGEAHALALEWNRRRYGDLLIAA